MDTAACSWGTTTISAPLDSLRCIFARASRIGPWSVPVLAKM